MTTKNHGPWRVLSQEQIYDNAWIRVTHHDVLTPKGEQGIYGTIHIKHLALAILPLDKEGYTWLVGQHRFPLGIYSWEIPEGGGSLTGDPLICAQRELREETGFTAGTWTKVLEMHLSNSVTDERAISYIATDLTPGVAAPDPTEELVLKRVPFEDVYQMVLRGEITDALSVATVLRARLLLAGL